MKAHPLQSSGPVLCIAGPTACGKTAAAINLAQALAPNQPLEIISVDSALVYRGMDIGTCLLYTSPSPRDRQKSRMPSSA